MEFSFVVAQVKKANESLNVGKLSEFAVRCDSMTMCCRMLSNEYFLAVVLQDSGNFGKCRFLMRMAGSKLAAEL
jgi:predicted regulator of Ras-like GTPase activity (Roadblock/LC7/MglB family)